ncbi:MAG: hypothetical protein IJ679_11285 [Lachnospiraceae bacterium]|nr:hypothetical protein [Lachnospiraceae bacterium]
MANRSEIIVDSIKEIRNIQEYMFLAKEEKADRTFQRLKKRYIELKVLLNTLGVRNLREIV